MSINESIERAKEIGLWIHGKTNDISVPNDERTCLGTALLQQTLDIADGIIVLLSSNLPGPAFTLCRSLHEVCTRSVWLLNHASDENVEIFKEMKYPGFKDMLRDIGDSPETGGAFIHGMSDLNRNDFHGLTHGGMEHVLRRVSSTAIEPSYPEEEIQELIRVTIKYSLLCVCFLLQLANDELGMEELLKKQEEWKNLL